MKSKSTSDKVFWWFVHPWKSFHNCLRLLIELIPVVEYQYQHEGKPDLVGFIQQFVDGHHPTLEVCLDTNEKYYLCDKLIREADEMWTGELVQIGIRLIQRSLIYPNQDQSCIANELIGDYLERTRTEVVEKVGKIIAKHRYLDATADRHVDPDLRSAFEALWEIGEFIPAYTMLFDETTDIFTRL